MSLQTWSETLISAQVDGAALTNTTPASIIPAAAKFTLPANFFSAPGKVLRARLFGRLSNLNPTPGNFTIDMRLGAVVAANGGAMALNAAAANTNVAFEAELLATCRAIGNGTSANLMFQWRCMSQALSALTTAGAVTVFAPATAAAVGTGFDSTASQTVDIFGTFSVNNAANTITIHQYILEALN